MNSACGDGVRMCEFMKTTAVNNTCPVTSGPLQSSVDARIPSQHSVYPPSQTVGKLPKSYAEDIPRSVNKPTSGPPPPHPPWKQCTENVKVNDPVRRPMARWSHLRPTPPIVIPSSEIDRIRNQITERDRMKQERLATAAEREAARLASYRRHSEWNYTVDSLIARKKKELVDKEKEEEKEFQTLSKLVKESRDKQSKETQARAKKQLLHRKGLIRDFHAAMAYSKALKDEQDLRNSQLPRVICEFREQICPEREFPVLGDPCWERVDLDNHRPEGFKKKAKNECSEIRLNILKCDENRVPERKAELEKEKEKLKSLRHECPLPWPQSYIKYMQETPCEEEENNKFKNQEKMREDYLLDIQDKLATDAFIAFHEKEIDRRAREYDEYKRKVERMRKEKEQQLIDEKVQRAVKNSEVVAKMWEEAKNKQKQSDEYSRLKDIWEEEHAKKKNMMKARRQGLENRISQDFLFRKDNALVKRLERDVTLEWEKSCCLAAQNYERQCEIENKRQENAKELRKYHLEQVVSKIQREEDERFLDSAYSEKSRISYACEMKEMKDYANEQIKKWKAKGRPIYPLIHAMKKWEYDAGMTPELYARTPLSPEACGDSKPEDTCPEANPDFESTAQRKNIDNRFCNNGEGQRKSSSDAGRHTNSNTNCSENTKRQSS